MSGGTLEAEGTAPEDVAASSHTRREQDYLAGRYTSLGFYAVMDNLSAQMHEQQSLADLERQIRALLASEDRDKVQGTLDELNVQRQHILERLETAELAVEPFKQHMRMSDSFEPGLRHYLQSMFPLVNSIAQRVAENKTRADSQRLAAQDEHNENYTKKVISKQFWVALFTKFLVRFPIIMISLLGATAVASIYAFGKEWAFETLGIINTVQEHDPDGTAQKVFLGLLFMMTGSAIYTGVEIVKRLFIIDSSESYELDRQKKAKAAKVAFRRSQLLLALSLKEHADQAWDAFMAATYPNIVKPEWTHLIDDLRAELEHAENEPLASRGIVIIWDKMRQIFFGFLDWIGSFKIFKKHITIETTKVEAEPKVDVAQAPVPADAQPAKA
jgi:hypothetical protein